MKHSTSPIWQKKRKRKFKNTKKSHQLPAKHVVQPKKEISKQKEKKEKGRKPSRFKIALKSWLKRHDSDIQLILFPLILLVIVIILYVYNNQFSSMLSKQLPIADNQITTLNPYPYLQAVNAPTISANGAIILDRNSQVILFSKNPQLRFSMASTTKIMTALVALAYYKPDDILTVRSSYVSGSGLNFYQGEQFRFIDLLYAMLLPSANDAAQAIADNYPGGSDAFVKVMNERAQSLHITNTHYSDPIGLDDDGNYSTVVDMARLASYAITNPTFAKITATKYQTIFDRMYYRAYPLTNTNDLLGIDGVTGIKTGTTEGAKEVLVTSAVEKGHTYIIVIMDSDDRFGDTSKLLQFINTNVKYVIPSEPQ